MKFTAPSTMAYLAFCLFSVCATVHGAEQGAEKKIVLGTKYSDASKLLSNGGSKEAERKYSQFVDPTHSVHYHPLREGVDLVATVEEASGEITSLALMTTPAYRPVKGLEVDVPITEFRWGTDGSFSITVPPTPPKKALNQPAEQSAPSGGDNPSK